MISTVNLVVINTIDSQVRELFSFNDDDKGNKEVEELFKDKIQHSGNYIEQEFESYVEDGHFVDEDNCLQYNIVHSHINPQAFFRSIQPD